MDNFNKSNFMVLSAPYQIDVPELTQQKFSTAWISWGTGDNYGTYIYNLYRSCPYLKACVDVTCTEISDDFWTRSILRNLILFGWCPLLVKRDNAIALPKLQILDTRYCRLTGDRKKLRYSPRQSVGKVYYSDTKLSEFFIILALDNDGPYPTPFIYPSVKAAQALISVQDHNISTLANGFAPSALVSFNNGVPDDETAEQIEYDINRKFSGSYNAGRVMVSFANDKDSAATVSTIPVTQFQAQFDSLVKSCKDQIFANFHVTPSLIGITDEMRSGFNQNEYSFQAALFHKFTIQPMIETLRNLFHDFNLGEPLVKEYGDELANLLKDEQLVSE